MNKLWTMGDGQTERELQMNGQIVKCRTQLGRCYNKYMKNADYLRIQVEPRNAVNTAHPTSNYRKVSFCVVQHENFGYVIK